MHTPRLCHSQGCQLQLPFFSKLSIVGMKVEVLSGIGKAALSLASQHGEWPLSRCSVFYSIAAISELGQEELRACFACNYRARRLENAVRESFVLLLSKIMQRWLENDVLLDNFIASVSISQRHYYFQLETAEPGR